jgi:phage terminase large subunit-like protein
LLFRFGNGLSRCLHRADKLRHDGNPVLDWCVGNVVGRYKCEVERLSSEEQTGAED